MWTAIMDAAIEHKGTVAVPLFVILLMTAGLAHVYAEQQGTDSKMTKHEIEYIELKAKVDAVGADVAYNRERGDIIQSTNTADHIRQEAALKSLGEKIDTILREVRTP